MSDIAKPNFHAGKAIILAQGERVASLEAALASKDAALSEWKAMHGRVVEGFMEVCEAVGVQFDAPEAVAHAINVKIANAEYDKRAAEAALAEMRAERDGMIARCRTAEADLELWQLQADNLRAELEEQKRLLEVQIAGHRLSAREATQYLIRSAKAEAEVVRLKKALKPFAKFSSHKTSYVELPVTWCIEAARALSPTNPSPDGNKGEEK